MNIAAIDKVLETYVTERIEKGPEQAGERFLALVYLKHDSDEILDFLLKVGGLARCYIYCLKIAENPFRGKDLAWFCTIVAVALYSLLLLAEESTRVEGAILFSGCIVHGWYLVNILVKKWRSIGMRISFYKEIIHIIERELCK
jgi:hypothetical protein